MKEYNKDRNYIEILLLRLSLLPATSKVEVLCSFHKTKHAEGLEVDDLNVLSNLNYAMILNPF